MGAMEFVVDHLSDVLRAYDGNQGHDEAYRILQSQFPELSSEMSFASFKQYAGIIIRLNKKINILEVLNTDKQNPGNDKQEINNHDMINSQINNSGLINSDKQNSDDDKQLINKGGAMANDKQKINISGWSIQKSGGFYRAFKRINGKMHGIYIGKNLDDADRKIAAKVEQLAGSVSGGR